MKCKEELGQTVIPVFYKVDPTDVKKQAGDFGKVFKKTSKGKTNEVIVKWSQALAKVATLAGYHSKNWDNEAKMIEDVATDVANKLFNSTPSRYLDEFIGMEAHMNKISRVLRTDLDEVRMIGIWGPAGIGKTAIARCLFHQLSHTFQYSVFMMNVKAMCTPPVCSDDHNVKLHLQQKFLSQLLNQKEDFEISHLGRVIMHDLLVQLGRDIVRKQSTEPGQRQFLVDKREICEVLADDAAGSRSVIGIKFYRDEIYMSERAFEGISNLQFLRLNVGPDGGGEALHLFGGPSYLSRKIRLLDWSYFPMTCLHCIPNPELLVELIMYGSKLEKLWEGTKPLTNLKWVDLRYSKNLKDVSSLSTATSLEELILEGCSSLVELPSSIGNDLKRLDLSRCSSLVELPSSIGNATNLQFLSLSSCSSLVELPSSIGNATNLQDLSLSSCSSLVELPSSIENITKLQFLSLSNCSSLLELPSSIGNAIRNLEHLDFGGCSSLVGVLSSIGNATNLRHLDFSECSSLVELPASIGNLHKLETLFLRECSKLEVLPVNINLKSLRTFDLNDCSLMKSFPEISTNIRSMYLTGNGIKEVPSSIRLWHNLTDLLMSNTEIQEISPWIKRISHLRRLVLNGCKELLSLPQLPSSLSWLNAEDCESLERLDCSFIDQEIELSFAKCFKLNKEARDVIIKPSTNSPSTNSVTILPGKEMPNYNFNYQGNGGSLVIKLNGRPSSSSKIWKACILLVSKDEVEAAKDQGMLLFHGIKQNRLDVLCSPSYHDLFPALREHLYIFEFKADVTPDELCFEFWVDSDEWMIKEYGVHYLN
ncbi:unnamed protein product [Brassica oleracea var. botrytis]